MKDSEEIPESKEGIVERSKLSDEISIIKNGNKVKIESRN